MAYPAAMSSVAFGVPARIASSQAQRGDLRIRVQHREYVQDVAGASSGAYGVTQLNINPGLPTLFPWLSQLAGLFESYQFRSLKFQYKTQTNLTNGQGKALLSADWDVLDPAPTSKQAQLQERSMAEGAVWENFELNCDRQDLDKFGVQRFVRQGSVTNSDLKTYDVGMLNLGTSGLSTSSAVGELYVEYDVELMTPNTAPSPLSAHIAGGGSISNAAVLGTAPVITGSLPVTVDSTGEIITFHSPGQYLLELIVLGSLSAISVTAAVGAVGGGALASRDDGTGFVGSTIISVPVAGGTATFGSPTGTITASTLKIAQYQYSLGP